MNSHKKQLLGALIGLARASESKTISDTAGAAYIDGLAMTRCFSSESFSDIPTESEVLAMLDRLHNEKALMAPDCAACQYPCGRTFDYDMDEVACASKALREEKLHLIALLETIANLTPANTAKENQQFISDALFQISCTYSPDQLAEPISKANKIILENR